MDAEAQFLRGFPQDLPELRAEGISQGGMHHFWPLEEGGGAGFGPIDELVRKDEVADFVVRAEAAHGGEGEDPHHPKALEGPDIGPIGDAMGWKLVFLSVAGEEGDLHPFHLAHQKP